LGLGGCRHAARHKAGQAKGKLALCEFKGHVDLTPHRHPTRDP
jgi:hypothetical protein